MHLLELIIGSKKTKVWSNDLTLFSRNLRFALQVMFYRLVRLKGYKPKQKQKQKLKQKQKQT